MQLDEKFLARQKQTLLAEQKRLEDELTEMKKFPDYGDTEDDNIMEVETFEENLGMEKGLLEHLRDVKVALQKIENGNYGLCEINNQPIEEERLESLPAARLCVEHAKEYNS